MTFVTCDAMNTCTVDRGTGMRAARRRCVMDPDSRDSPSVHFALQRTPLYPEKSSKMVAVARDRVNLWSRRHGAWHLHFKAGPQCAPHLTQHRRRPLYSGHLAVPNPSAPPPPFGPFTRLSRALPRSWRVRGSWRCLGGRSRASWRGATWAASST